MAAESAVVAAVDSNPHQVQHETRKLFRQLPHQGAACFRRWTLYVRLSQIHDHEQEIALKKVSGTLEASENSAKPDAGEFQTPFSTNPGQSN